MSAPPRRRWLMPAIIGVLVVISAIAIAAALRPPDVSLPAVRWTPFATEAGYQSAPAWSPDGKQIAYEAEVDGIVQVFTRQLGSPGRTQVTHTTRDCYVSAWSSDGYIYFHSAARNADGLWKVSPVGGNPELVLETASRSAISPDGKTLFYFSDPTGAGISFQLWSASMTNPEGTKKPYAREPLKSWNASSGFMKFSPDGSKLLVWLGPGPTDQGAFFEIPMPDGEPRQVLSPLIRAGGPLQFFTWVDDRYLIMARPGGLSPGGHLWLADIRTDQLHPLTTTPGNEGSPSLSPDGRTIAITSEATDFDVIEVPLDGSPPRPVINTTRDEFDPAVSPNGSQFAFVTNRTGYPQIWMQSRQDPQDSRPIVTEPDFDDLRLLAVGSLSFSSDGTRLAFQLAAGPENGVAANFPGGSRIWVKTITGGKPFPIGGQETFQDAPTWSPKDDWIAYLTGGNAGQMALAKSPVGTRGSAILLSKTGIPPFVARPQWSPDGSWVLCETTEGLSIIAADGSFRSRVIGDVGWLAYAWDASGRNVYGLLPSDDLKTVTLVSIEVATAKQRVVNTSVAPIPQALQPIRGFSRYGNGAFLTSIAHARSDIYLIEGFQLPLKWWERFWRIGTSGQR